MMKSVFLFFFLFFKVNKSSLLFTNYCLLIHLGKLWQKGPFSGALFEWVKKDGAECKNGQVCLSIEQ